MKQNIEQIFKDALSNLEADVPPNAWTNIQQGLQTPANVAGSSAATKSASILGKMGIKSLLIISAASVTVISSIIYFTSDKAETKKAEFAVVPAKVELENVPAKNLQVQNTPPVLAMTGLKNIHDNKQNVIQKEKKISGNQEVKTLEAQNHPSEKETDTHSSAPIVTTAPKVSHPRDNALKNNPSPAKSAGTTEESKAEPVQPDHKEASVADHADPVFDAIENYLVSDASGKKGLLNAFSPNGDGKNDFFMIETTGLKSLEVIIYDMKGKKIRSWNSLNIAWDGTLSNGRDAESGNYFYTLSAETTDGKICIAKSSLALYRNPQN